MPRGRPPLPVGQHGATDPPLVSRRMYLAVASSWRSGTNILLALEAVASVAIEHPEWGDLDEQRTWPEWEREYGPV